MADFGGFEIEDETNGASSNQSFGGFEVEADVQDNKQPLEVGGFEVDDTPAPTWESGDGGASTLPDGQTNQWGGNLRIEGRKPLIRRDENGKVSGYSTTTSMFVQDRDGKIAVIPTVVDGKELSQEDAVRHYAETGEHWGKADDEDSARKMARAVHDEHAKSYGKGWNDYVQEHWDEMGDEIRGDPGVRGEHARRRREARIADELKAWGRDADVIKGYRERTKTTQVAPELFLVGGWLEDADGNVVKPGDAIAVSNVKGKTFTGEDGQSARLMEFTGVTDDGKPTFKEVEGVSSEGAFLTGKLHVLDSDFNQMVGKGEGKVERSPLEQVRLGAIAETGDRLRYTDDALGTAKAVFDRVVPYFGRMAPNEQRERTRHLSNIYEGKLDGYDGKTEADKYRDAARKAGLEPWNPLESLHPNESEAEFMGRIQHEAGQELKSDAMAKLDAGGKLEATEASVLDKIVKGGIESGGYALEFALPGGAIFKGAQALNWGAKAVRAATMLGSAVPVVATEAMSRYQENITPEYGFGRQGEFKMVAAPDDEEEAAYKAIGGAMFDTAVEVGLEAVTMGLLRVAGKASGWALGKVTPGALKEFGAKKFNKFMASETGLALRQINRAYQDFALTTGINSPFGEMLEENVQAAEKVLNLDGKTSEYKGLQKEWNEFYDRQFNADTQWDIFYGLIAQLGLGAAKSTAEGVARHVSTADVRRDIRMALKRSGISDETISTLTPEQQQKLNEMWQRYSTDPDKLKEEVKNLGISMRLAVDELTARDGLKMRQSLEQRGIAPERFTIQTGEDGKPAFQQMMRFTPDGKQAPMNAMTDAAHGVTIADQGDGTFYVMNDFRGFEAIPAYSFDEAQKKADAEVVRNQSMDADNEQKAQYLMGLVQRQYAGRNVVSIPSEAALRWQVAQAVRDGRPLFGITRADQLFREDGSLRQPGAGGFHTPDGHIVVILDNVPSPAEMERVLAHEATGHEGVESATGRGANTVEFIQNAQAEGFSKFVLAEQERAVQRFVAAGMNEATARMQVAAAMSTDEYAREAMARYAQGRLHQPTWYEKRKHELNQRRRDAGENVPIDQSDLEVMLADAEKQGAQGENELETLPGDSGVRYEEGATDEARNGADEAQPQPEQGEERGQEAPRPEAGTEPGAQAPDAGVVERSNTTEDLRDASDKASQALQDAESRLSKWLKDHPRQETEDGRVSYGNGGTVREFRELEAAVEAAREKSESAESEYRKAKRAENAERGKAEEQKRAEAKKRREEERKKWRDENPVTAQLEDIEKNVLLPAENGLEDLLDSDASTNEQKAEAYRKVKEARKVVDDFKSQHKEELEQEAANRKAKENADEGVVESSKSDNGGQNLTREAKNPKGKRGDNLRGRSYEDYAKTPDEGGTADEMGAALLRFARDNGGLLKMPPKGAADPMADWINAFLDGGGRKKNRGEFIALFGMKPKTGTNDAIAEDMPTGLKDYVEKMIERDGPGAVAEWFLETRRKYREWAQGRRDAAREERQAAKDRAEEGETLESFDFDELAAAQDALDEEFANALGVVEGADEADYAALTPASLQIAKSGDTIRFDHDRKSFVFGSFDAGSGVLVVYDEDVAGMEGGKFRRAYRVTENSIEEIDDGQGNEVSADADRAGDEKGPAGGGGKAKGGGFRLESVTAKQITAEEKKRREKAEIKKRQEAPLKGSGAVNVQPEMNLGQTGQQDLFSPIAENEETTPAAKENAAERPAEYLAWLEKYKMKDTDGRFAEWQRKQAARKPAKNAPVSAPQKAEATTPPKPEKPVEGRKSASEVTSAVRVKDGVANANRFKTGDKVSFIEELATMSSRNTASRIDAEIFAPSTEEVPDKVVVSDGKQKWMVDADLLKTPEEMDAFLSNRRKTIEKEAAESAKSAPASAPSAKGTTTPPKGAGAPQGGKSAEDAAQGGTKEPTNSSRANGDAESAALTSIDEIERQNRESAQKVELSDEAIAEINKWIADNPNGNFADNGLRGIFDAEMERAKARNGGKVNPADVMPTLDAISVAYDSMKNNAEPPKTATARERLASVYAEWADGDALPAWADRLTDAEAKEYADLIDAALNVEGDDGGRAYRAVTEFEKRHEAASPSQTRGTAPESAPKKTGAITPPKAAKSAGGGKSSSGGTSKSSAPTASHTLAKPAFKRGDRVFLKGANEGQRVTFLKANADGTADVQVRTPGANRYAPEKVETRTVPMDDVSTTGMKDTLTGEERNAYRHGMAEQTREAMRSDPALRRIDAAYKKAKTDAERAELKAQFAERVRALQGGVNFDTPGIYTGSAADYANRDENGRVVNPPSLQYVGSGEGTFDEGWGLYGANSKSDVRMRGYAGLVKGTFKPIRTANGTAKRPYFVGSEQYPRMMPVSARVLPDGKDLSQLTEIEREAAEAVEKAISQIGAETLSGGLVLPETDNLEKVLGDEADRVRKEARLIIFDSAMPSDKAMDVMIKIGQADFSKWKTRLPEDSVHEHIYEQTFFTNRDEGDETHLINLSRGLTAEQKQWIQNQAKRENLDLSSVDLDGNAHEVLSGLAEITGGPRNASEFLVRSDIDGTVRGNGLKYYVSFRDDNIRVDHKWTDGVLQFDTPELSADYSSVPERLDHSLWWISTHDEQMQNDIAALRKTAERNIRAGADDTPSEQEARDLKRRINEENAKARARKKLADETSYPDIRKRYLDDEQYYRENAKELRDQLKELEKEGIGEDRDEVDWYTYGDLIEILDAIESGEASASMLFDPHAIGRGEAGPFAEALKNLAESGNFKGKDLERFNRIAKKINDAYKTIEADIEDPRGPFGESLVSFDTPELSPVTPEQDAAYMDAVKRGDMETAQRMVREAAASKGYKLSNGFFVKAEYAADSTPDKWDVWAYEVGRQLRDRYGELSENAMWNFVDFNEEFSANNVRGPLDNLFRGEPYETASNQAYFSAGFNGEDMPRFVFARRVGRVPESGQSYNFRDQKPEGGVSVLGVYEPKGFREQNDGTYRLFNGGKEYLVAGYEIARRGSDGEPLLVRARTLGDAEGAIKSADPVTRDDAGNVIHLSQRFNRENDDIRFDTPELTPAEAEYAASEDKTPTEKVMREVYGMTNDEIATALRAAGMEPPSHVRKTDADMWRQVETLLSNSTYMAKLSRAVAKFPRPTRDYENVALNVLFRQRQAAVNDLERRRAELAAIPEDDMNKTPELRNELKQVSAKLAQAKAQMGEAGKAAMMGASEQGRALRSNRALIDAHDYSYAGIAGRIAQTLGGIDKITPEMNARIRELAKLFEGLDAEGLRLATERLIPLSKKVIDQTKNGLKVRKATERKVGDVARHVTRNYQDALTQIEVGAVETGGTLIGLSDQQYPSWGKWLRQVGEYYCFLNPDITEEEVIDAIVRDISPFMDGVDANQVRDALTGFGHNYKQSRYDAQRLMNSLRNISRSKRQIDWMDETNTMPPATGPIRDEPTQDEREWTKRVRDRKAEVPDAGRDERRLKSTLDTIKRNLENRIADLKRAIETGERIPVPKRKVVDDIRVRELRAEKDELQKQYDELFGTTREMTDAQRIALTEKLLAKELERAMEDFARAQSGDFSKRPQRPGVTSETIETLRDRIRQVRESIRELKNAKYAFGMTPEEIEALNARKMASREKALARLAERIATGDIRPQKKPQPPMTKDQQKRYDELGEQMKRGRQKLAELRLEAENATVPTFVRKGVNFLRFVTTAQRALRATMDFSAVLRQAARMTLGHPVKAARSFGKAWTAARSEASLLDVNTEILSDPTVQEAVKKFGLHLREVDAQSDRDVEMFHGMERNKVKIFGKEYAITDIPFFGEFMLKSERHYLTYLNAMSADLYTSIVNGIPGGATPWQKKMIADMINIWNGSAALSKERRQALQKAWVNDIFWAPQLAISRVQSAVGYDIWHPLVAKGIKNADGSFDKVSNDERKTAAKIGLREHLRSTVAMLAIGSLLKWLFSDDDDKYDFSQADWFEKMMMLVSPKIGNTTIDLTGGESTFNRLVHQLATKSKRSGTGRLMKFGDFNGPTTMGTIGRYLQGKLSPSASTIVALWEGKDYVGEEYGAGKMVREMLVPLTFEDVKDQIVQNGVGKSFVTVPLSILGAGGSTYDRKPYENAVNRFLEEKRAYDAISKDAELTQSERKELLDGMKSESPLMADSVRGDIDARIKAVNRLERKAKDIEKKGGTPTASLTKEIERQKSILLDKIRRSRRK